MTRHLNGLLDDLARSIRKEKPLFALSGFSFWFAYNLASFDGGGWLSTSIGVSKGIPVSVFVNLHLLFSAIALLVASLKTDLAHRALESPKSFLALVAMASICSAGLIVAEAYVPVFSVPGMALIVLLCAGTGVGTTALFLRSGILFSRISPVKSLVQFCFAGIIGCFILFMQKALPGSFQFILFVLLPLIGGCISLVSPLENPSRYDSNSNVSLFRQNKLLKPMLCVFGIYVFSGYLVYSYCALYGDIHELQSINLNSTAILVVVFCVFALLGFYHNSRVNMGLGTVYSLTHLITFIFFLLAIVFNSSPELTSVLQASVLLLFFTSWCIYACIVYRTGVNPIKMFGYGNFVLTLGNLLGSLFSYALYEFDISAEAFAIICIILALCCFISLFAVFPPSRLNLLLEESSAQEPQGNDVAPEYDTEQKLETIRIIGRNFKLSQREQEVLELMLEHQTPDEIADKLCISTATARTHIRNIYSKCDVHSRQELNRLFNTELSSRLG